MRLRLLRLRLSLSLRLGMLGVGWEGLSLGEGLSELGLREGLGLGEGLCLLGLGLRCDALLRIELGLSLGEGHVLNSLVLVVQAGLACLRLGREKWRIWRP